MNGAERLSYAELLGLAQNLVWMCGGQQIYEERLQEFNDHHTGSNPYPRDGRFELMRKLNKYNKNLDTAYFPQRLENFSPYPDDLKYRNLITAERVLMDGIELLEPINKLSLRKAEDLLSYEFNRALDSLDDNIYIFRLPTGIGKTWQAKDLDEVTIAFPTNDLKQEVFEERMPASSAVMTPEFPLFSDDGINQTMDRLFKTGFVKQAHKLC